MKPILSIITGLPHMECKGYRLVVQHKIRAGQKFQPRDKIPKSESTDTLAWKRTGWLMQAHTHASAFKRWDDVHMCPYVWCGSLRYRSEKCGSWSLTCWPPLLRLYRFLFTQYDYVAYCLCRLVEICLHHQGLVLTSEWASAKPYLLWRVFKIHLLNFLSLRGVVTLVSCSIVALNLQVYFSSIETVLRKSNFPVFSPLMLFLQLIAHTLLLICRKCLKNGY